MLPVSALEKDILKSDVVKGLGWWLFGLVRGTVSTRAGFVESLVERMSLGEKDFIV